MGSRQKPHAICIPYPAQSHIKGMLQFAQLLYNQGCQITFVNTEYNHQRFLRSWGSESLAGLPDFRFETIPDGLPPSDSDTTQDIDALCESLQANFLSSFTELLEKIPSVTCVVSDGFMSFSIDAGKKLGIPVVLLWTISACSLLGYFHIHELVKKGFIPFKDASYLTNSYMDTVIIDWIPGMKNVRLRDMPAIIRTTDPNNITLNYCMDIIARSKEASAFIIHTFDDLEADVLTSLSSIMPLIYTIGPLQLQLNHAPKEKHVSTRYSLWKEEPQCIEWLDSRKQNSVLYVNFGSVATISFENVVEIAHGLASSGQDFLWIIRPDLVKNESTIFEKEYLEEIKDRGCIASWCSQEQVLNHQSVKGFFTHCGWGSIVESFSAGVPMICLPLVADQSTNCKYLCNEWGVGLEINANFKSDDVEKVMRALMEGEKGNIMKKNAMEWKEKAENAVGVNGSSSINLDMFIKKFFDATDSN